MSTSAFRYSKYLKRSWDRRSVLHVASAADALGVEAEEIGLVLSNQDSQYTPEVRPKKTGGERLIQKPSRTVRKLQEKVLPLLYGAYRRPAFLHGGVPGRSVQTLATPHVGKSLVMCLDIADFFPSIKVEQVVDCFTGAGYNERVSAELAGLCMTSGGLPQGGITSPCLANLVGLRIDEPVNRIARRKGLSYGRFVDDLVISGDTDFRELVGPFVREIERAGFRAKEAKTRLQYRNSVQVVCGIAVNDKLRPTREYRDKVGMAIQLSMSGRFEDAAELIGADQGKLKARLNGCVSFIKQHDASRGTSLAKKLNGIAWDEVRRLGL